MTLLARARAVILVTVAALGLLPSASAAQAPTAPSAAYRDSLLGCAAQKASPAGFRAVPGVRPGRLALMRTRVAPDSTHLLDALGIAMASQDSTGAPHLEVRVTTFVVSPTTGLSQQEVAPPPSLTALADSIRLACRGRR
jgi:hypothetical protein